MDDPKSQTKIDNMLSHSAKALLHTLERIQKTGQQGVFQPSSDVDQLHKYLETYKGNLYEAITRSIVNMIELGGVEVISQDALHNLIQEVWKNKVSKLNSTEIQTVTGLLNRPHLSMKDLARYIDLSYGQTRRAIDQLESTSILQFNAIPNVVKLGLDRILIDLEEPKSLLVSPYITRYLFVDGPIRRVFLTVLSPSKHRNQILKLIPALRKDASSVTAWRLSTGKTNFSAKYYDRRRKRWDVNVVHFKLLLHSEHDLVMSEESSVSKLSFPPKLSESECKIIDLLLENYNTSAREISENIGGSESMIYRHRAALESKGLIIPRPQISLPVLTDRIICTSTPEISAQIMNAWNKLPLTFTSRISNLENHQERKVMFTAALPTGGAATIIEALSSEELLARNLNLHKIDAYQTTPFDFSNRYDYVTSNWAWESDDIDITTFHSIRSHASHQIPPFDLA